MDLFERYFTKLFFQGDLISKISNEERRKRYYVFTMAFVTIPIVLGYGIVHLFQEGIQKSWADLSVAGFLIVTVMVLRKFQNGKYAYRIGMAGISLLLLYNVTLDSYQGGDILWFYIYPFIPFFLFGVFEGFLWVICMMIPTFIIILFPELTNSFVFATEFKLRLIISLTIISFTAWLLESLRSNFFTQIKNQKTQLEIALNSIKTLQGMLPICSQCKKIRDDKGYWNQIESYISEHSEAEFSHGVCPECSKKLYPDYIYDNQINYD